MIQEALVGELMVIGLSIHVVVTALESLADKERYSKKGILCWEVSKLQFKNKSTRYFLSTFFQGDRYEYILKLHFVLGVFLAISIFTTNMIMTIFLYAVLYTTIMIGLRHHSGLNGDYHISLVVIIGLLLWTSHENNIIHNIGYIFIASQIILSYLVSGVLKLFSAEWRSGAAIINIFSANTWGGTERIYELIHSQPYLAKATSWIVILFECLFFITIFVSHEMLLIILPVGLIFHIGIALFMGLNRFAIIFPASYPAIYYTNLAI